MASPYAYVCTACDHLASRHGLMPNAETVNGPYACTHQDCQCQITQTDHVVGIDEATFNRVHLPHLDNYVVPA